MAYGKQVMDYWTSADTYYPMMVYNIKYRWLIVRLNPQ